MSKIAKPETKDISAMNIQWMNQLHLGGMAEAYKDQITALDAVGSLPFDERLSKILSAEVDRRETNSLNRRLNHASLVNPMACVENIRSDDKRKVNMEILLQLSKCDFIEQHLNVAIEGAAGVGKTYIASAIGNAACRKHYRVKNLNLSDLMNELLLARRAGETKKVRDACANHDLLIFDDWLLFPLTVDYTFELLDVVEACYGKCSMIFCSQYASNEWYNRIDSNRPVQNSILAEAVLDRIIHNMTVLHLESTVSMRSLYDPNGNPIKR